jgi:hypothetical protein
MLVWGFGATIRRSGYRFIADGADRHEAVGGAIAVLGKDIDPAVTEVVD